MNEGPINIWGKQGCELPQGGYCNACCIVFRIASKLAGGRGFFEKEAGVRCKNLNQSTTVGGCDIQSYKPSQCYFFHCSSDELAPMDKAKLIYQAASDGLVDANDMNDALARLDF